MNSYSNGITQPRISDSDSFLSPYDPTATARYNYGSTASSINNLNLPMGSTNSINSGPYST